MGVTGLWQLIDSIGSPVTLESLEGKVLAVDVSIWLNQALKGYKDGQGAAVANAHLMLLFTRVCKLLYYRIKPVFVFDGAAPILKKQTLDARSERKEEASEKSGKTRQKILTNYLKKKAINSALGNAGDSSTSVQPSTSSNDIFDLPPLPVANEDEIQTELDGWDRNDFQETVSSLYQDLGQINPESEDFHSLPAEIQHELLSEIKEVEKTTSWARLDEMPEDSNNFSDFQMQRLLKKNKLSQKIEDVRKVMNTSSSSQLMSEATGGFKGNDQTLQSKRVLSEDTSYYLLIKGVSKQSPMDAITEECSPYFRHKSKSNTRQTESKTSSMHESKDLEVVDTKTPQTQGRSIGQTSHLDGGFIVDDDSDQGSKLQEKIQMKNKDKNTATVMDGGFISEADEQTDTLEEKPMNDGGFIRDEQQDSDNEPIVCIKSSPEIEEQDGGFIRDEEQDSDNEPIICLESSPENEGSKTKCIVSSPVIKELDGGFIRDEEQDSENEPIICVESSHDNVKLKTKQVEIVDDKKEIISRAIVSIPEEDSVPGTETFENVLKPKIILSDDEESNTTVKSSQDINFVKFTSNEVAKRKDLAIEKRDAGSDNDDDSEFLEVTIEPNIPVQDELFPASVFETQTSKQPVAASTESSSQVSESHVESHEEEDSQRRRDEDVSNKPTLNEFIGLSQSELEALSAELTTEGSLLHQEKGRLERLAVTITDQMYSDSQELLKLFGVPYIVSPSEAEAQCAQLELAQLTNGSITDDSDIWLFGGANVFRNFFNKDKVVKMYKVSDIERHFGLDRRRFVSIALVTGCDYTEGIFNAGPVTAMEILSEFPHQDGLHSMKMFKEWWTETQKQQNIPQESKIKSQLRQLVLKEGFPSQPVVEAFLNPSVDVSEEKFTWGQPDLDLIREFALEKLGLNKNKTDEMILPVIKQMSETQRQKKITNFFTSDPLDTESVKGKKISSKRVQRVVKKFTNKDDPPSDGEMNRQKAVDVLNKPKTKRTRKPRKVTKKAKDKDADDDFLDDSDIDEECIKACEEIEMKMSPTLAQPHASAKIIGNKMAAASILPEQLQPSGRGRSSGRGRGRGKRASGRNVKTGGGKRAKTTVVPKVVKLSESSSSDEE